MKTLISSILAIIIPLMAFNQGRDFASLKLKTLDERTVNYNDIFKKDAYTLIYFFNESCKDLADQFEYLENVATSYHDSNLKVVAIFNPTRGTYGNIRPFLNGNNIDIETYIDVNGELQRAMGLPLSSVILLSNMNNQMLSLNSESVTYSDKQLEQELVRLLSSDYPDNDLRLELMTNYFGE